MYLILLQIHHPPKPEKCPMKKPGVNYTWQQLLAITRIPEFTRIPENRATTIFSGIRVGICIKVGSLPPTHPLQGSVFFNEKPSSILKAVLYSAARGTVYSVVCTSGKLQKGIPSSLQFFFQQTTVNCNHVLYELFGRRAL